MKKKSGTTDIKQPDQNRKDQFITPSELATRWAISESAVYHGKCGTSNLTRVRFGNSLRFLREEVERLEKQLINKASRYSRLSEDPAV